LTIMLNGTYNKGKTFVMHFLSTYVVGFKSLEMMTLAHTSTNCMSYQRSSRFKFERFAIKLDSSAGLMNFLCDLLSTIWQLIFR
ncbi:MAG: hypothetical protein WBL49_00855, partial [Nitrososphaeraceae archaeon]